MAALKQVCESQPFGRNLLKNPSPYGLTHKTPPPEVELSEVPPQGPPRFQAEGNYTDWTTRVERLPLDRSRIPQGAAVCGLPEYSWFTLEQRVDLKAEGIWDELLDKSQPDIEIQDWYEESQVHEHIYQLHVKLLTADGQTVISEHHVEPTEDRSNYKHTWKEVSHVFTGYGPGVRYVLFSHRVKNMFLNEFFPTLVTDSSVTVKNTKFK
ncbi:F-box only protein 50 [Gadus morhua]|uniref:P1, F-box associated domain containing n=1 Tax=Gadus morhua TaxID=8049 RepID=A0ABA3HTU5_GADMO|nr:F-box only protein 50 [Gadus morhua]